MVKATVPKLRQTHSALLLAVLSTVVLITMLRAITCEVRVLACLLVYFYAAALYGFGIGLVNAQIKRFKQISHQWYFYFAFALAAVLVPHFSHLSNLGILKEPTTYFYYPLFLRDLFAHEVLASFIVFIGLVLICWAARSLGDEYGKVVEGLQPRRALFLLVLGVAIGWLSAGTIIAFGAPPVVLAAVVVALLYVVGGSNILFFVFSAIVLVCSFLTSLPHLPPGLRQVTPQGTAATANFWRSYYHVETYPVSFHGKTIGQAICGNHNPLQFMLDLNMSKNEAGFLAASSDALTGFHPDYYGLIYDVVEKPESVLILGAGGGNEVAAALMHGAGHVDAVDADSWMFELGKMHPQKPYDSPKVRRIVADPRRFLLNSQEAYDLIIFANLESQTAYAPFSILRTDSFMYTIESFADARSHLKPHGCLAVSFIPIRGWITMRMANNALNAFNRIDGQIKGFYRNIIMEGADKKDQLGLTMVRKLDTGLVANVESLKQNCQATFPCIDNWPFVFAHVPSIPRTYLYCIILLSIVLMLNTRALGTETAPEEATVMTRPNLRIALLAMAMTVLLIKAGITFGYNFGLTWDVAVNSAIATTLVTLIGIVLSARKIPIPTWLFWIIAVLVVLAEGFLDYYSINYIDNIFLRSAICAIVPLLPGFLLAFAIGRCFDKVPAGTAPLGMLCCGAGIGAALESLELLQGISLLSYIAVFICVIVFLMSIQWKRSKQAVETQGAQTA